MKYLFIALLLVACGSTDKTDETAPVRRAEQPLADDSPHDGAKGEKGDKGDKGETGEAGKTIIVSPAMWYDPVEQRYWLTAGITPYSFVDAQKACSGLWRLPSYDELYAAVLRGFATPSSMNGVWTSDMVGERHVYMAYSSGQLSQYSPATAMDGVIRCVEI